MGYEAYNIARESQLRTGAQQRAEMQEMQARRTRQQAGNALADGDYGGAANALFQGGDLQSGLAVQSAQSSRQTADRERQRSALAAAASGLLYVPEAQRAAMFQNTIAPRLVAEGVPQEIISQITPEVLTDQSLRGFVASMGGEVETGSYMNAGNGRIVQTQPYGSGVQEVYAAPQDPLEQELLRARIDAARAQVGQREASAEAARARAARSGGSGGGSRRSGGGSAPRPAAPSGGGSLPPGFTVRRR